jgi:hypothetical protein
MGGVVGTAGEGGGGFVWGGLVGWRIGGCEGGC